MSDRRQLVVRARALRAEVVAGRLSDLEALARLGEARAVGLGAAPGWWRRWRYVVDLTAVLTEIDLDRPWPHRHREWVQFGQRGFQRRYWSRDPLSTNQVRHLVGYVPLGFLMSGWLASSLPYLLEIAAALVRRQPIDWPDIHLGVAGVWLGHGLLIGRIRPAGVGEWLRAEVGEDDA